MKHLFTLTFLFTFLFTFAQKEFPPLSVPSHIKEVVGYTTIEIAYDRPSARGRQIFGGLVPYDEVWRTGGGRNTVISFSTPVTVAGKTIPAGDYNLLSIPGKEQWSFILNQDKALWGTYNYDASKDILEFDVLVEKQSIPLETMTLVLDVVPYDAILHFMWEDVHVQFPIQTRTNERIESFIQDSLTTGLSENADDYFNAAHHLLMLQDDYELALDLVNKSVELKEDAPNIGLKAELLYRLGRKSEATEIAEYGLQWELDHEMNGQYFKEMIDRLEE